MSHISTVCRGRPLPLFERSDSLLMYSDHFHVTSVLEALNSFARCNNLSATIADEVTQAPAAHGIAAS